MIPRSRIRPFVDGGLVAVGLSVLFFSGVARAQFVPVFTVNTTSDTVVPGACANGTAGCSLRGAIQAANSAQEGVINFSIAELCATSGCVIQLTSNLSTIASNLTIEGPGPDSLTVRGNPGGSYAVFTLHKFPGTANISGLTITNGTGGGILVSFVTANVTNCRIIGNDGGEYGGGIYNSGTLNISNSTISGNTAWYGGGIFNEDTLTMTNCTVSGNTATGRPGHPSWGGAIANISTLNIRNCTISGNSAISEFDVGFGGGVYNYGVGPMNIRSSIVANNGADSERDVSGTSLVSQGFNLIGTNEGSAASFPEGNPNANMDIVGTNASPVDPKLDPNGLQNNGGLTETIALVLGSPAIDKGTSAGLSGNLTTDQRGGGFPRVFDDSAIGNAAGGDGADIGAFELQTGQPTKLANISTRLAVQTGDNVLIGGFIITGTQPKKVILRATGPSLNLPGQLANPTLELFQGNTLLGANDDWQIQPAADHQAVIDSGIPPTNDAESALVRTLTANGTGYTAIVKGANNGTGIGVVEAYDLDRLVDSKLANISTRGFVQTGDNVLIAGTIILGNTAQRVIIRALGPSLSLPGKMVDPILELRNQNGGLIDANDNWVDSPNKQAIMDTGIPPSNDKESAIVQVLPGSGAGYTAIVRGVNDATGIAVVEVYALN